MIDVDFVFGDVIDDDGFAGLADFMADGGLDLKFVPGLEAEIDLVKDAAGDPVILGDPGYGRKTHARGATDDVQNCGDCLNTLYALDILPKVLCHLCDLRSFKIG